MTIETAKTLAARHGGQIEREIMGVVGQLTALQACALAAVNAWMDEGELTAFDEEMAALERLLSEMEETVDNAPGPDQEALGQAGPPVVVFPPSDDALIGFLAAYPRRSLTQICERFGVTCAIDYNYTPEAKAISRQLQRLRKDRRIRSEGQRWTI